MAKAKTSFVRVYNKSRQTISLQLRPPGGDFYLHEQQAHIGPGKDVLLPKDHLISDQIDNLRAKGLLAVVFDSNPES